MAAFRPRLRGWQAATLGFRGKARGGGFGGAAVGTPSPTDTTAKALVDAVNVGLVDSAGNQLVAT